MPETPILDSHNAGIAESTTGIFSIIEIAGMILGELYRFTGVGTTSGLQVCFSNMYGLMWLLDYISG